MADEYSTLLIRVLRGEESLGTAFWVTLILMSALFAYEHYVPSLSDIFLPYFHFFDVFILTYTLVAIHHSLQESGLFLRLVARTYVLALLAAGAYITYLHYGLAWACGYPFIALLAGFLVQE